MVSPSPVEGPGGNKGGGEEEVAAVKVADVDDDAAGAPVASALLERDALFVPFLLRGAEQIA